jgi:putative pyruvate formate lyase activating enzyme
MEKQSRRQFVKSCVYVSVSGLCPYLCALLTGCDRPESSNARRNELAREEKERLEMKFAAKIDPDFEPPYLRLHRSGELKKRGKALWNIMESCELCPRRCGANRLKGDEGFCQASSQLEISSYHPHFGEERPLVGRGGSGTIFLTNCGLRCVFCIN